MMAQEINFDGLIGPTHNYAGLSLGNVASSKNAGGVARPKLAALQGLGKMRLMLSLGLGQGVLLPQLRPHLPTLHALGFRGSPERMIADAHFADPALLRVASSASSMWTANAATVSPSADTADSKVHFTTANLATMLHRSIEHTFTEKLLRTIFHDQAHFAVHAAVPGGIHLGDEGAANHGRLSDRHGNAGVEVFVYSDKRGGRFPGRQSLRASEAVVRLHGLAPERTAFLQQANAAIEGGAFHNDVVSVTNGSVLFTHGCAFENHFTTIDNLRKAYPALEVIEVPENAVPMADAISSYLFNSQLVTLPDGSMALILPTEVEQTASTAAYVAYLLANNTSIKQARYIDVRESMKNGGGPACLRLRVVLTEDELAAADQRFIMDDEKILALENWVNAAYPNEIHPDDLGDIAVHRQCLEALDTLTQMLNLDSLYSFQLN